MRQQNPQFSPILGRSPFSPLIEGNEFGGGSVDARRKTRLRFETGCCCCCEFCALTDVKWR
jgi:hypothetical protein